MSATRIAIDSVSVAYGDMTAVDQVNFAVEPGEILALVGPSGCGKTSLLKSIAGLEPVESGSIAFDGARIDGLPSHRRGVGMVFQNYALFPHMRVAENVRFGLRMHEVPGNHAERVAKALDLLQIGHLAKSWPDQLSGGQQQRVALARTLVIEPKVLLLDEPLSALDRQLRDQMRIEIRSLVKEVGITTVIVTHDQEEALSMADRIAVMRAGRIEQIGEPGEIYRKPATRFVAGFMGRINLFEGKVSELAGDTIKVRLADGAVIGAQPPLGESPGIGADVTLAIRPEAIRISDAGYGAYSVKVTDRTFLGERSEIRTVTGFGTPLTIVLAAGQAVPDSGSVIGLYFDPEGVFVFPKGA
jgi:putative spermidine/putrescine transport system ATP-binding protein